MSNSLDSIETELKSTYKVQNDLVEIETLVGIHWASDRGWFEQVIIATNSDVEEVIEGGLWFSRDGDKFILYDYDGVYELPFAVVQSLKSLDNVDFEEFIIPDTYWIRPLTLNIERKDTEIHRQKS